MWLLLFVWEKAKSDFMSSCSFIFCATCWVCVEFSSVLSQILIEPWTCPFGATCQARLLFSLLCSCGPGVQDPLLQHSVCTQHGLSSCPFTEEAFSTPVQHGHWPVQRSEDKRLIMEACALFNMMTFYFCLWDSFQWVIREINWIFTSEVSQTLALYLPKLRS